MIKQLLIALLLTVAAFGMLYVQNAEGSGPRGVRNNNPMNIEATTDKWLGQLENCDDSRFICFADPVYGIRAGTRILLTYQEKHKINTLEEITKRYAPAPENSPESYSAFLSKETGFSLTQHIDLRNPKVMQRVVTAIIKFENAGYVYEAGVVECGVLAGIYGYDQVGS